MRIESFALTTLHCVGFIKRVVAFDPSLNFSCHTQQFCVTSKWPNSTARVSCFLCVTVTQSEWPSTATSIRMYSDEVLARATDLRPWRQITNSDCYRQDLPQGRSSAGIVFTHEPNLGGFRPAGATRCTDRGEIWQGGADRRRWDILKLVEIRRNKRFCDVVLVSTCIARCKRKLDTGGYIAVYFAYL